MRTLRVVPFLLLAIGALAAATPVTAQAAGSGDTAAALGPVAPRGDGFVASLVGPILRCEVKALGICLPPGHEAPFRADQLAVAEPVIQQTPEGSLKGRDDAREAVAAEKWLGGAFSTVGLISFLAAGRESALSQTMEKGLSNVETGTDYTGALVAGGVGTVLAWGIGRLVRASQFPNLEPGANTSYAEAYRDGYRSEQRRIQSRAALLGGVLGTGAALLVSAIIDAAF